MAAAPSDAPPPRPLGSIPRVASYMLLETATSIDSSYSPQPQRRGVPSAFAASQQPPFDRRDGGMRPAPIEVGPSLTSSQPTSPAQERPARSVRIRSLQHPTHEQGDYEWLRRRLCDGEACTCLSLTGNWAVALTKERVGEVIDYTVRDKVPIPGKEVNGVKRMQVCARKCGCGVPPRTHVTTMHAHRLSLSLPLARAGSFPLVRVCVRARS